MAVGLHDLFVGIPFPAGGATDQALYGAATVPGRNDAMVARDHHGHGCLLLATDTREGHRSAIRLRALEVHFGILCRVLREFEPPSEVRLTVVECRSQDAETVKYFFLLCEAVLRVVGTSPSESDVRSAIQRLAAILRRVEDPASRQLTGLFGELFLIRRSSEPQVSLAAWRVDEGARFDFALSDLRVEVKASSGRVRQHTFSYDQCNPPHGTVAVIASLFVECVGNGCALSILVQEIEDLVASRGDLVFKLHENVASALGGGVTDAMAVAFDERLARDSMRFYDAERIPAIRGALPSSVSDVHFRSDLTQAVPLELAELGSIEPNAYAFLPSDLVR